ncbi:MAG: hypothetical protein V1814_00515 [Candidatus Moraniibacteriota bacterium]
MGNPHRKRGTGKRTPSAWRNRASMEGEPVTPEVFVQQKNTVGANDLHTGPIIAGMKTPDLPDEALKRANAERLADMEREIGEKFSGPEKEFVDSMTENYPNQLWAAKKSTEDEKKIADDQWAFRFRQEYIKDRVRLASEKNKWGANGPLTDEKAKLFKEYLELKLPDGIPPEKPKINESSAADPLKNQDIIGETGRVKIAKVSTDERAPEFPDVPPLATPKLDAEPAIPKPEDIRQAELNQAINDFEAKQSQIAETRAKKTGRFASLAKSLGIKTRNLDDDPEVMSLEKESHDLYRNLLSKGIHLYKSDKAQLENFLKQFDEFGVFKATYNQEMDERARNCKWPETVLAGFQKIGQKWSELNWKQKLVIGGAASGLMTVGAIGLGAGAGIFGAASLMTGWRWAYRGFGAMAAGVGRKVQLDVRMMKEMEGDQEKWLKQKMDFLKQYEDDVDQGVEKILNSTGIHYIRKEYEQKSFENTVRARNLALKAFVISSIIGESFRLGSQATGINMGSILKKIGGYAGFGGGGSIVPEISKGSSSEAYYAHSPDGKTTGLTPQGDEHFKQFNIEPHDSPSGSYDQFQKPPIVPEPEVKMGGSAQEWAKTTHAAGAEVQTPEMAKPQFEDIASVKIKAGGNMWGSIENNIKANPAAYGLDPNDPGFTKDMHRMTKQMLDEFAYRKGMSYEQLDQIARTKLRAGDTFKIIYNPSTEEISLDDFHGKAFGADVSHGGAGAVEEIASSKPNMAVEDVKPRTGAAEHQPSKGPSKITGMEEIEADYQKDLADRNYARAVRAEQDLSHLHERQVVHLENVGYEANLRQVLATRGLLNRIVEGAGVGNNVSFWEGSASDWHSQIAGKENYIPQDVQLSDQAKKLNLNLGRLKQLFAIMAREGFRSGESNGECLTRIMNDPINVQNINKIVLRK